MRTSALTALLMMLVGCDRFGAFSLSKESPLSHSAIGPSTNRSWSQSPAASVTFFATPNPNGHRDFIAGIGKAKKSIKMTMFHLTEAAAVQALLDAQGRGVNVRIIIDKKSLQSSKQTEIAAHLRAAGAAVKGSSAAFSITHVKAMTLDDQTAFITSMNLTDTATDTRDFGVSLADPGVVAEMNAVFEADWQNADSGRGDTPTLSRRDLIWSPVDSRERLKALIDSATDSIVGSVENLGDPVLQDAFIAAASRRVNVRLITPLCNKNSNHFFDVPFVRLLRSGGVDAKMMPSPATPDHPYIHAKMLVVDDRRAYLGSINFSTNSTTRARELGIVTTDQTALAGLGADFEKDWAVAVVTPEPLESQCSRQTVRVRLLRENASSLACCAHSPHHWLDIAPLDEILSSPPSWSARSTQF
jgi:phosphatidylserine/phosphatidylglycerophosphate/cardiolipin synthase-like enzyme